MVLVVARDLGGRVVALRGRIPDLAGFAVKGVYGTFKEVIRNPVNVAAVRKPLAPRGDVVGRALTLGFNEKRQRRHVLAVPGGEGIKQADAFSIGAHLDFHLLVVGENAALHFLHKALHGELFSQRDFEGVVHAVFAAHRVLQGIKGEVTLNGHRHHDFGGREERVCLFAPVIAAGEVTVKGLDDGIRNLGVAGRAVPLADAGTAGGCQNRGVQFFKDVKHAVAL